MKKVSLKRTRMKPWRRAEDDKTQPAEYEYVMARDVRCVAAQVDPDHRCRGRDTLDHVPEKNQNAYGDRAPSDRLHLVRLCDDANSNGWASANRDRERAWIAVMEDLDD